MTSPELWSRIQAFEIDLPNAALPFSQRLARDNAWSHPFALRVIAEYKRFLYLASTSHHSVTPSDAVDQAWHLHLCYTRSYWDELCAAVLQRPLHHGPTKGGPAENHRFLDLYQATLDAYKSEFGAPTPVDIWPSPSQRFSRHARYQRLDRSRYVILPRPSRRAATNLLFAAIATTALIGCGAKAIEDDSLFAFIPIVFIAAIVIVSLLAKKKETPQQRRRRRNSRDSSGCSAGSSCSTDSSGSSDSGCSSGCGSGCGGGGD